MIDVSTGKGKGKKKIEMYYMIMISNYFSMFREAFKKINILMMIYENFIDKIGKKNKTKVKT